MHNQEKKLTIDEAYDAIVDFLEQYYNQTHSGDIGSLMDGMSFLENDIPVDPAALQDWQDSVAEISKNKPDQTLTIKEAYDAMNIFLQKYQKETDSDDIKDLLSCMRQVEWVKSTDKILNQKPRIRPRFILIKPGDDD